MTRSFPGVSEQRVDRANIRAVFVQNFSDFDMTFQGLKTAPQRNGRNGDDYFEIPSLEMQDSVLNFAGPALSTVIFLDADKADNVICAVLDADDD